MNSHVIPVNGYQAPIVRTGYEYVTAHRNTSVFAYSAEKEGKVISVTKKGMVIEYNDSTKVGLELGKVYGKAEGSVYPHTLVSDYAVGDTFIKGDVVVYNSDFYQRDIYDPKAIVLKNVAYGKVALMENNNTHEDSSAISKEFSTRLVSTTTKVKNITVRFDQNIHHIVKIGDTVKSGDSLVVIEDEISSGFKFDDKALGILQELAQQTPASEYSGSVENIEILYHGELEDMSSSLRQISIESDKRLAYARKSTNKAIVTGKVDGEYKSGHIPLALDTLEIKIYISVKNSMGVGDKGIFANQLKSVIGEVMNYSMVTENGEKVDAVFGFRSIYARIVLSPMLIGTTATLAKVIGNKAVNMYKK